MQSGSKPEVGCCGLPTCESDFGGLLDGTAGGKIVRDRNAQCALAVIADDHGGSRIAVDRAGPLHPEVHGIATARADQPSRTKP